MFIRSAYGNGALVDYEENGDTFKATHIFDNSDAMESAQKSRNQMNNGWSEDRTMRRVGCIPMIEFVKHPEWQQDPNLITKWLKTEEGRPYRTVEGGI